MGESKGRSRPSKIGGSSKRSRPSRSGGSSRRRPGNNQIMGRPKKPPIMGSERTDEGGSKTYTCHVLGCGKIF